MCLTISQPIHQKGLLMFGVCEQMGLWKCLWPYLYLGKLCFFPVYQLNTHSVIFVFFFFFHSRFISEFLAGCRLTAGYLCLRLHSFFISLNEVIFQVLIVVLCAKEQTHFSSMLVALQYLLETESQIGDGR